MDYQLALLLAILASLWGIAFIILTIRQWTERQDAGRRNPLHGNDGQ